MVVGGKHLRKFLLNKRASSTKRAGSTTTGGASEAEKRTKKQLVTAAASLLPLPWDAMLGYGNPRREVRFDPFTANCSPVLRTNHSNSKYFVSQTGLCVFFTLNRYFYLSTSNTTSVRADSPIPRELQAIVVTTLRHSRDAINTTETCIPA